jgi:hypothetical protein
VLHFAFDVSPIRQIPKQINFISGNIQSIYVS